MTINTSAFIETLIEYLNKDNELAVYYDRAPDEASFPYGVVSSINATPLYDGVLTSFDIVLTTDDRDNHAMEAIENQCDRLANLLTHALVKKQGVFYAHIDYSGRNTFEDKEDDLIHRSLFFNAKIFYM